MNAHYEERNPDPPDCDQGWDHLTRAEKELRLSLAILAHPDLADDFYNTAYERGIDAMNYR